MQWGSFVLFHFFLLFCWSKHLASARHIPGGELLEGPQVLRNKSDPDQGLVSRPIPSNGLVIHQHSPIGYLWPLAGTLGLDLELHYGELDQACHHLTQTRQHLFRQFNLTNRNRLQLQLEEEQVCSFRLESSLSLETKHRQERGILQDVWQGLGKILGLEDEEEDYVALESNQLELQARIRQLGAQTLSHLRMLRGGQEKLAETQALLGYQELVQEISQARDHFKIILAALRTGRLPDDVISEIKRKLKPKTQMTTTQATLNSVLQRPWTPTATSEQSALWQRLWSGLVPMKLKVNQQAGILRIAIRLPQVQANRPFRIRRTTRAVILPNTKMTKETNPKTLQLWEIQSNRIFSNISEKPFVDFPEDRLEDCLKIGVDFFCAGVQEFQGESGSCEEALWKQDRKQVARKCMIRKQFANRLIIPIGDGEWILQCKEPEPAAIIGQSAQRSQTLWCSHQPQQIHLSPYHLLKMTNVTIHGAPSRAQHWALQLKVPTAYQWQWQPLKPEEFPEIALDIHQHPLQSLIQSQMQEQARKTNNMWLYTMLAFITVIAVVLGILLVRILSCTLKAKKERQQTLKQENTP